MVKKELLDLKFRGIIEEIKDSPIPTDLYHIHEISMMIQDASDIGNLKQEENLNQEENSPDILLDENRLKILDKELRENKGYSKEDISKLEKKISDLKGGILKKRIDLLQKKSEEIISVPPSREDIQSNIRNKLVGNSVRVNAYIDKLSPPEVNALKTRNIITGELYGKSCPGLDYKRWSFDLIKVFQVNGVDNSVDLDINDVDLGEIGNFETITFDNEFEYDVMTFDLIKGKVIRYLGETKDPDYYMVNLQIEKIGNIKLFNISGGKKEELGLSPDMFEYLENDIRANEGRVYYVALSKPPKIGDLCRGGGVYQRDKTKWWHLIYPPDPVMQNRISQIV